MGLRFKTSTKYLDKNDGIVYLLEIHLEDKVLVKIGITGRDKIEDRVAEISVDIFKSYRFFPYIRPKRFKKTTEITVKESILHTYFKDRRYTTQHQFGGHTELFDIPLDEAVEIYERVLNGEDINTVDG